MDNQRQQSIQTNHLYYFMKSGNQVRAIRPVTPESERPCWEVERTTGASAGKRMIVLSDSLVKEME